MTTFEEENVTERHEDLGKSRLNWNNLPPEMKCLCIKEMDFKARTGLRCSSKTERRLVDSVGKYKFNRVELRLNFFSEERVEIIARKGFKEMLQIMSSKKNNASETEEQKFQRFVNSVKQVLSCDITTLTMTYDGSCLSEWIEGLITNGPVLSVKKLKFCRVSNELLTAILKHCDGNQLTDIEIDDVGCLEDTFLDISQVFKAKRIRVDYRFDEFVDEITFNGTMKWLELNRNHPEVGKVFQIMSFPLPMSTIIDKLGDSIVHHHPTEEATRVTTSDPSLHFWIYFSPRDSCLQMFIVPSDSADPDFEQMDCERFGPLCW